MEGLNVRLLRGEDHKLNTIIDSKTESIICKYDHKSRVELAKTLYKSYLAEIIQPIISGTMLSNYTLVDKIMDNINLDIFANTNTKLGEDEDKLLYKIVLSEIYRIAIQCTAITSKDYAAYINNNDFAIRQFTTGLLHFFK